MSESIRSDFNACMHKDYCVRLLAENEQLLARAAELERKNAEFAEALKEKMILTEGAYVLRKQAEAVERVAEDMTGMNLLHPDGFVRMKAQSIRQQADEADEAGR